MGFFSYIAVNTMHKDDDDDDNNNNNNNTVRAGFSGVKPRITFTYSTSAPSPSM